MCVRACMCCACMCVLAVVGEIEDDTTRWAGVETELRLLQLVWHILERFYQILHRCMGVNSMHLAVGCFTQCSSSFSSPQHKIQVYETSQTRHRLKEIEWRTGEATMINTARS